MRIAGLLAAWTATMFLAFPAMAWYATGNRIVAAIAYERLDPQTRARVDALIRRHPDYDRFIRNAPLDPPARARSAFIAAAVWADDIKTDRRFWDDTRKDAQPTPPLPGFPDMKRHTNWHYYDKPYAPDHAHFEKAAKPNALTELPRLIRELGTAPEPVVVYDLPWIEHIVADLHQPLHCISRFLKSEPTSDAGGNRMILASHLTLHSLWDAAAGDDQSDAYVTRYAAESTTEHPPPQNLGTNPQKWIQEGFVIAKKEVYTFGNQTGSAARPLQLPDSYVENTHRIARARIPLAGCRLAAILSQRLR